MKFSRIPRTNQVSAAFGIFTDRTDYFIYLMDASAIRFFPVRPLGSIDAAKVTVFICPLVPNGDLVVSEIPHVGVTFQKPEELVNDGAQMKFLRGQKRKGFVHAKASLSPEDRPCPGSRSVAPKDAFVLNVLEE